MFAPIVLYVSIVSGFVASGWATDQIFAYFRKKDEEGQFDSIGVLLLWAALFGGYSYFMSSLLH